MPAGHRRALLALCTGKRRLPIIEGGAYHKLCYDTEAPLPLKAINQSGRAPYLGSTSKNACAGAAHRLGHCTEPIIQRQSNIKMQADYRASSISQWIFAEFLTSGLYQRYLNELRRKLCRRGEDTLAAGRIHSPR